jgi:dTDP-4-dehydrorhamnose reductase
MKIEPGSTIVFGSTGQLAQSFQKLWPYPNSFLSRAHADFENPKNLLGNLNERKPKVVINTAAFTAVDKAENPKEKEIAILVNGESVGEIAKWCAKNEALLVHFSTDYVYGESSSVTPWVETDLCKPLNAYGESKLFGERQILQSGCAHLIFRVSWLYALHGNNFLKTMMKLGAERESLQVIDDQKGYPSYTLDVARAVLYALEELNGNQDSRLGIYNLAGPDSTSWNGFAKAIFEELRVLKQPLKVREVSAISTQDWIAKYPNTARRPQNSCMSSNRFLSNFGMMLPPWRDSLVSCLKSDLS